jgi:hypothetical protein
MPTLTVQGFDEWMPIADPCAVGVFDRTVREMSEAFGWTWDEVEEEGLGQTFYLPLAWDGRSRFLLTASGPYPENGIAIETSASENPAIARADLLEALGLEANALLAISEGNAWFARWDPPHNAGVRPSTAAPRDPQS